MEGVNSSWTVIRSGGKESGWMSPLLSDAGVIGIIWWMAEIELNKIVFCLIYTFWGSPLKESLMTWILISYTSVIFGRFGYMEQVLHKCTRSWNRERQWINQVPKAIFCIKSDLLGRMLSKFIYCTVLFPLNMGLVAILLNLSHNMI